MDSINIKKMLTFFTIYITIYIIKSVEIKTIKNGYEDLRQFKKNFFDN